MAKTTSPTPADIRTKLAAYNSSELTTFFAAYHDTRPVARIVKYANRALQQIEAEADQAKVKELQARKKALEKELAAIEKSLGG